jgi:hypothetical protein
MTVTDISRYKQQLLRHSAVILYTTFCDVIAHQTIVGELPGLKTVSTIAQLILKPIKLAVLN